MELAFGPVTIIELDLPAELQYEIEDLSMENECRFTGYIGKDPNVRDAFTVASVAVYGGKDKEGKEKTEWVGVFFRGDRLKERADKLKKGDLITVRCAYRTWKEGEAEKHAFDAMSLLVIRKKDPVSNNESADGPPMDDIPF